MIKKELPSATVVTYQTNYKGTKTEITVTKINIDIDFTSNQELINQRFISGFEARHKAKLLEEKEFEVEGRKGKEYTFEMEVEHMKLRVLFFDQMGYQMNISCTDWQLLNENKKMEFESEAKRFFDSFALIK